MTRLIGKGVLFINFIFFSYLFKIIYFILLAIACDFAHIYSIIVIF